MKTSLTLVSLTVLAFAACGGDSAETTGGGGGGQNGATTSDAATSVASSGAGGESAGSGGGDPGVGGLFEAPNPWTKDVSGVDKSPSSDAIIGWLSDSGGWGNGNKFQIDFGMEVLAADTTTMTATFTPTSEFYDPDCDNVPFPMPEGGAIEGEQGYACESDGDCHLIVVDAADKRLYEMWRANLSGGTFFGGCAAVWELDRAYPENLRGEGCTSADAGGFPIAAMLFSADEVFSGEITHAIRFILPNDRIRDNVYVHPGTHSTFPTSGGPNAPPYGVRFRLRPDFPLENLPSEGARVVARGLQKYGMFLADGGNIALTAQSDRFTEHTWAEVEIDSHALYGIEVTDMEVVDMGAPIDWSGSCARNTF